MKYLEIYKSYVDECYIGDDGEHFCSKVLNEIFDMPSDDNRIFIAVSNRRFSNSYKVTWIYYEEKSPYITNRSGYSITFLTVENCGKQHVDYDMMRTVISKGLIVPGKPFYVGIVSEEF